MTDYRTITNETMTAYRQDMRSLAIPKKAEWTKRIVNTEMPVYAIPIPTLRKIANEIFAGDYETFLEKIDFECYEDTVVYVAVLSKIKDFETTKKHFPKVIDVCDNWSTTDSFRPKITKDNSDDWWNYALELLSDNRPFARRFAIIIFFSFIKTKRLSTIFDNINSLYGEKEYYVNMAASWLVAECFIKRREETMRFYMTTTTNDFIVNKSISKCRDSFRVSPEDKQLLLSFKR